MNRAQLSLISAACFIVLLIVMLLPWWSVDGYTELNNVVKEDASWFAERWDAKEMASMFGEVGSKKGASLNGFQVGGFAIFLFGLLAAGAAGLVLMRKSNLVPLDQRQLLFLSVALWALTAVIALIQIAGAPSGKTFWGWLAVIVALAGGATAFLATSKKKLKEDPAAPKPAAAPAPDTSAEKKDSGGEAAS